MRTRSTHHIALLSLVALVLAPSAAGAQNSGGSIDLQLFRPAIDSKGYFTINASQVLRHLDPSFGLVINYARRPLSFAGDTVGNQWHYADGSVIPSRYRIENLVTGNLQAALGLFKHFEVGLGLPVTIWNGDTDPNPARKDLGDQGKLDAQGIGDLALHFKGRILNTSRHFVGLGAVLSLTFPTSPKDKFLGTGRFGIHPTVILDKEFFGSRLSLALNVGGRFLAASTQVWDDGNRQCEPESGSSTTPVPCGTSQKIEDSHALTYGIGAAVYLIPQRLSLVAEIFGQSSFNGFATSAEVVAGMKLYLARNSYFAIGAGRGLRGQGDNFRYGTPDVRVFAAFIFEPSIGDRDGDGIKDDVDKCPDEPEDFDDFEDEDGCPDADNDRDGICDPWVQQKGESGKYAGVCKGSDKCPDEPEDIEGFEDDDGCPEAKILDRDGDGIPDNVDKCPDEPEDKDGFEDEDGCPDLDNDKDGIPDVDDLCPNEPEDIDGFEDKDGCPDPDNDKDRIPDKDDKCPNEPETYNGFEDEDGCPDKGRVVVHKGRIEILDKIYFETDKAIIKPVSYPILDAIAATLKGNPQILLIEIQGHADERGSDDHNLKLTDDRAHAVQTYVVNKGVEAGRLRAKGYGETRPVDKRHNEEAWSKNRRVEFVILKRAE